MEKTIIVSRATIEDLESVAILFDKYRIFYDQASNIEEARHFMKDRMTNNESVIFIASEKQNTSNVLGFVQLYPSFSSVSMKKIWVLNDLYVDQSARKQGVGLALMKKAEEFASRTGAIRIILETGKDNIVAQALYESIGYEKETDVFHYSFQV